MEEMREETFQDEETMGFVVSPEELDDPSTYLDKEADRPEDVEGRIERLYTLMSSDRRLLDAVLKFCAEPRTLADVTAEYDRVKGSGFTVYDAVSVCNQLVKAGALDEIAVHSDEPKVVVIDGVEYLEPADEGENATALKTTQAGAAHLEAANTLGAFDAVLEEDGRYEEIFRILLDCCANEGGATAKQMGDAVDDLPELQDPRMYASYFFNRMDTCGLIEWTGSWTITDLGLKAIAYLDGRN